MRAFDQDGTCLRITKPLPRYHILWNCLSHYEAAKNVIHVIHYLCCFLRARFLSSSHPVAFARGLPVHQLNVLASCTNYAHQFRPRACSRPARGPGRCSTLRASRTASCRPAARCRRRTPPSHAAWRRRTPSPGGRGLCVWWGLGATGLIIGNQPHPRSPPSRCHASRGCYWGVCPPLALPSFGTTI